MTVGPGSAVESRFTAAGFNRLSHQEIKTSASVCFTPSLVCGEKTKRACL